MLKGTNQEFGRPYNRRIVMETIRKHGPVSRADIAARVGLTVQTVSNIIKELEEQGFIRGTRDAPKGRGYPATNLSINPDGAFAIGLCLTPRGLEAALVNLAGDIIERHNQKLRNPKPNAAFAAIAAAVQSLKDRNPGKRLIGAGLAMPGPFDVETMSFVGPTTLEGWKGISIEERLAEATGLPSFIEIDHAAAALGETLYGKGASHRDFFYVYFGVGLGGCMVIEGQPYRGRNRNAGEIGHLPMVPGGEKCPCGNQGCLERYLSLEARERKLPVMGEAGWTAEAAPLLRNAIVMIENMFDPETIVLGGLLEREKIESLVKAAGPLGNSVSHRQGRQTPRLLISEAGPDAILRGAAALAISGVLSPRFGILFAQDHERQPKDPMMRNGVAA